MSALRTQPQATTTPPSENRRRPRLHHNHGAARGAVTPIAYGMACWRELRVLIVDDEHDTTGGLFAQVGAWGHDPQQAGHGQAARIAAGNQPPDVVLLSLDLSSMDRSRLARQLRRDVPRGDCFIIAIADWADDQRRRLCGEAGIDLLLVKPVDPSVLEVLLGLEWVRMNQQRAAKSDTTQMTNSSTANRSATC